MDVAVAAAASVAVAATATLAASVAVATAVSIFGNLTVTDTPGTVDCESEMSLRENKRKPVQLLLEEFERYQAASRLLLRIKFEEEENVGYQAASRLLLSKMSVREMERKLHPDLDQLLQKKLEREMSEEEEENVRKILPLEELNREMSEEEEENVRILAQLHLEKFESSPWVMPVDTKSLAVGDHIVRDQSNFCHHAIIIQRWAEKERMRYTRMYCTVLDFTYREKEENIRCYLEPASDLSFPCCIQSSAQKEKDLAKAYPSTPQEAGLMKIRLNYPTIVKEGISNMSYLLNQLYNKKVLDENDMMLIQQANDISNKTRKLLSILFIKDPMAWVFDVLQHIENSRNTVFLYQMIATTYTGLDSCHQADMWKIVMQADNRNHKAVVLKEMIRQNLMYLTRVLTKKPLTEIDISVFTDAELEYITSQPDKKQEVKASLICLLGRENVGWVFEFIGMLLNDGRNQLLANVFGTTNVTEI